MITFAGISVHMITRILAQVIEDLCILHDGAGSLSQIQKFIELSLNESLGNVVRSKSGPEFILGDNMTSRLHGMVMVPPSCWAAKRALFSSEHGADSNANLDSMIRSQASASRGSSALWNNGSWVLRKS
jgi:hypothetical protein